MKKITLLFIISMFIMNLFGQKVYETAVLFEQEEYWWGEVVAYGAGMPYLQSVQEFNLALQNNNNQMAPLFLSSKGRYIWSDKPFFFEITDNTLKLKSEYEQIEVQQGSKTLKEAYFSACHKYFPPTGLFPDQLFFTMPQYNTWIELMYNQNEKDILAYVLPDKEKEFAVAGHYLLVERTKRLL
jgi:alpha-glucosidase